MSDEINWRGVNLNLLRTFDALMEHGTVTKAAEQLHIGQPAMSYNLNQLRNLLKDPLFERQGHRMVPTYKAEDLAPKVRQVLNIILNDILLPRPFDPEKSDEKFVIGLSDYAELVFGPLIYDMVSKEAPYCQLVFQAVDGDNCKACIEDGVIDLAIGVYGLLPNSIHRCTLYRERHICLYDDNAMHCGESISLGQYLNTPHAVVTATGLLETAVDKTLEKMGKRRRVVLGSSRFLTLRHVLEGRKLICVMAEMMARIPVFDQQLTMCKPPLPVLDFDVEMLTRKRGQQYGKIAWLTSRITEIIRDYVDANRLNNKVD